MITAVFATFAFVPTKAKTVEGIIEPSKSETIKSLIEAENGNITVRCPKAVHGNIKVLPKTSFGYKATVGRRGITVTELYPARTLAELNKKINARTGSDTTVVVTTVTTSETVDITPITVVNVPKTEIFVGLDGEIHPVAEIGDHLDQYRPKLSEHSILQKSLEEMNRMVMNAKVTSDKLMEENASLIQQLEEAKKVIPSQAPVQPIVSTPVPTVAPQAQAKTDTKSKQSEVIVKKKTSVSFWWWLAAGLVLSLVLVGWLIARSVKKTREAPVLLKLKHQTKSSDDETVEKPKYLPAVKVEKSERATVSVLQTILSDHKKAEIEKRSEVTQEVVKVETTTITEESSVTTVPPPILPVIQAKEPRVAVSPMNPLSGLSDTKTPPVRPISIPVVIKDETEVTQATPPLSKEEVARQKWDKLGVPNTEVPVGPTREPANKSKGPKTQAYGVPGNAHNRRRAARQLLISEDSEKVTATAKAS